MAKYMSFPNLLKQTSKRAGFILMMISVSACSLEASIVDLNDEVTSVFSKGSLSEVTAGSSQNSKTLLGRKVQASVSYQEAVAEGKTTRGYRVYTNVQGTIFKE